MTTKIKAQPLVYDSDSGKGTIVLTTQTNERATLEINLKPLLPFINIANENVTDFFIFSAAIYGIDRFVQRRRNSVDGWSREFEVEFPVQNPNEWNAIAIEFNSLLSFLTGDYWTVEFYQSSLELPAEPLTNEYNGDFSQVSLLSGGLDSLIGAIDFLKSRPNESVLFASQYDPHMRGVKKDQIDLLPVLTANYPNRFLQIPSIKVSLTDSTISRESTFRSRSILFVGLALLIADGKSIPLIVVPENGSVSLNYPLSSSRRSACSTRTTHPVVLNQIQSIWRELGVLTTIENPYEFSTKGEMVDNCADPSVLSDAVEKSNSCGKRGHVAHWDLDRNATHCGVCMPCVYRRASLVNAGDSTSYGCDINGLPPFKSKKSQDIGACLNFIKVPLTPLEIKQELMVNGVRDLTKIDRYVDLVERTRDELKNLIVNMGSRTVKNSAGIP
ncbi:MAG: hypothetical protein JXQ90_21130 [Cyclobacteriaceae bacterium]